MNILVSEYAFSESAISFYLPPLVFEIFSISFHPYPLYAIFFTFFWPISSLVAYEPNKPYNFCNEKSNAIVVHVHLKK